MLLIVRKVVIWSDIRCESRPFNELLANLLLEALKINELFVKAPNIPSVSELKFVLKCGPALNFNERVDEVMTYKLLIDYHCQAARGKKLIKALKLKIYFLKIVP